MVAKDIRNIRSTLLTSTQTFSLTFFVWHYGFCFVDRLLCTKYYILSCTSSLLCFWYLYLNLGWLGWGPFWSARKFCKNCRCKTTEKDIRGVSKDTQLTYLENSKSKLTLELFSITAGVVETSGKTFSSELRCHAYIRHSKLQWQTRHSKLQWRSSISATGAEGCCPTPTDTVSFSKCQGRRSKLQRFNSKCQGRPKLQRFNFKSTCAGTS